MPTQDEDKSPGRPAGEPPGERRRPPVGRQECAVAATGRGAATTGIAATGTGAPTTGMAGPGTDAHSTEPATTPGLVVTEDRLADGRAITYFGTAR